MKSCNLFISDGNTFEGCSKMLKMQGALHNDKEKQTTHFSVVFKRAEMLGAQE
jgi:hypothetical protein